MPKQTKRYNAEGFAGCVQFRKVQRTGTMVGIYHAEQAGLCVEGGPWVTSCEHGSLINHNNLRLAKLFAPVPDEWCEECHAIRETKGNTNG